MLRERKELEGHTDKEGEKPKAEDKPKEQDKQTGHSGKRGAPREPGCDKKLATNMITIVWLLFIVLFFGLFLQYPPFDCVPKEVTPQRIGIVGGGIAGMGTAWRLAQAGHDVTLFESTEVLGGHASTYYTSTGIPVDLGFRYFKDDPNFEALLRFLNFTDYSWVPFYADKNMVVSENLPPILSTYNSMEFPELTRFVSALQKARSTYDEVQWMTETLETFLNQNGFSSSFITMYVKTQLSLLPITAQTLLETPIALIYTIDQKYNILSNPYPTYVNAFNNGTYSYIQKFQRTLEKLGVKIKLNTKVDQTIVPNPYHTVTLTLENGNQQTFDHVVSTGRISDIAQRERNSNNPLKRSILGLANPKDSIPSEPVSTIVTNYCQNLDSSIWHNNCRRIPPMTLHFNSQQNFILLYNTLSKKSECYTGNDSYCLFLSYPSTVPPIPNASRIFLQNWTLPLHNSEFLLKGRNFHKIQGNERIWYAGDVASIVSHEFALVSGLVVAKQLGGRMPWGEDVRAVGVFMLMENWMM